MCSTLYFSAINLAWVPFPAPGAPNNINLICHHLLNAVYFLALMLLRYKIKYYILSNNGMFFWKTLVVGPKDYKPVSLIVEYNDMEFKSISEKRFKKRFISIL